MIPWFDEYLLPFSLGFSSSARMLTAARSSTISSFHMIIPDGGWDLFHLFISSQKKKSQCTHLFELREKSAYAIIFQ